MRAGYHKGNKRRRDVITLASWMLWYCRHLSCVSLYEKTCPDYPRISQNASSQKKRQVATINPQAPLTWTGRLPAKFEMPHNMALFRGRSALSSTVFHMRCCRTASPLVSLTLWESQTRLKRPLAALLPIHAFMPSGEDANPAVGRLPQFANFRGWPSWRHVPDFSLSCSSRPCYKEANCCSTKCLFACWDSSSNPFAR